MEPIFMKLGVIYLGFNNFKYVKESILPWVTLKYIYPEMFIINAVSVPFLEYKEENIKEDETTEFLKVLSEANFINKCFDNPKYIKENEARNLALFDLLKKDVDYIMLVDSDEIYTLNEIENIFNFIKNNDADAYKINLKNYIFDGKSYLDEFCPPRIFKTKINGGLNSFYWDNEVIYNNNKTDKHINFITIPKEIAFVRHMTWLHENGEEKVKYHKKHFGGCSYIWDEKRKELSLDIDYYDRMGYKRPIIHKE